MMKAPKIDVPTPPPPPQSPTAFSGKKKPTAQNPIPTFLGTESTPGAGQTGGNTLLGQ